MSNHKLEQKDTKRKSFYDLSEEEKAFEMRYRQLIAKGKLTIPSEAEERKKFQHHFSFKRVGINFLTSNQKVKLKIANDEAVSRRKNSIKNIESNLTAAQLAARAAERERKKNTVHFISRDIFISSDVKPKYTVFEYVSMKVKEAFKSFSFFKKPSTSASKEPAFQTANANKR